MKPKKTVKACVERIIGKFAVISVCADRKTLLIYQKTMLVEDKKYIIVLRKTLPPEAREGNSFEVSLGRDGIEWALPDLENTIKQAKLMNEISDYMGKVPA
jgi:hypothetical protein